MVAIIVVSSLISLSRGFVKEALSLLTWIVAGAVACEAFNQRRKTLRNTLKPLLSVEDIEAAEVDPILRPEQLDLAAFVRLANRLAELPGNR